MSRDIGPDTLLSPSQLADFVGVNVSLIRTLMRDERLEHLHISPKVRKTTLRAWEDFKRKNTRKGE